MTRSGIAVRVLVAAALNERPRSTLVIMADRISELRLTAFKSFRDVALPLSPLAVLIGRNGGGKSNALDALEVLSRLAKGTEIRDALDGMSRDAGPVRGGVEGCPPYGSETFELGITVRQASGGDIRLDVRIQARPQVQVLWERLVGNVAGRRRMLLETLAPDPHRADIEVKLWNGKQGRNPHRMFRASHLVTAQLPLRLESRTEAERCILQTATTALGVLGGVFHLDPVPHLMRHYVPEQDVVLRRTGENLSAAVARLRHDEPTKFTELVDVIKDLPEHEIRAIEIRQGGFGEVMLGLSEVNDGALTTVSARQMSDGMLRMTAIATALLTGSQGLAIDSAAADSQPLTLVLEELENGLHPTQAARVLNLLKASAAQQSYQVVLTTHSPALLNALNGNDHPEVVLIRRDQNTGRSRATRLVDLPNYYAMMASGGLGDAVAAGRLLDPDRPSRIDSLELDKLLGIA
ncbi:MAG: AAA family ATPase [Pseudonocardiaceae bacterium]